jgi:aldehyde dehydrogenase (NAD+)
MNAVSTVEAMPAFIGGTKQLLIGGKWQPSASGKTLNAIDPATGQVIAQIAEGDAADVDLAVRAARRAFEGEWSRWTPLQRQCLLNRVNELVDANWDELALIETHDMGAPITRVNNFKSWISQAILFFASQTRTGSTETLRNSLAGNFMTLMVKTPVGVVGGIIPWNQPLVSVWWTIGAVLATGCTAVIKPAEDASLSILRIAELLGEAGMPDGVINVVTGLGSTAGAALASHPNVDRIGFTGSTETGRKIVQASSSNLKRVQLELGGKSPDIVFADADLDAAVPGAAMAVYGNSGQVCTAGTRLFVQRSVQQEFVSRLKDFSKTIRIGRGVDPKVQVGPLISRNQLDRVLGYVRIGQDEGATLEFGGQRLGGALEAGYFVEPTIFSGVHNRMTVAQEEIFGPVISVIPFDDASEALRLANDTPYGLGAGVWTRNLSTAMQMAKGIEAGTVWVNCYNVIDPSVGFGGWKMSGYGWKGGKELIDAHLVQKAVYLNVG